MRKSAVPRFLPVEECLPQLRQALADKGTAVLVAPPGSGKTTRVPLALLEEDWLSEKKILMLEPRRIAARLAAGYMSGLCHEEVGGTVGYQIRFERRISALTRIEVITEGLLTRRLQHDPELADVGLVIFDEFHERSLDADLALALCLDTFNGLRDNLRLLVMSATMDARPVSRLLGDAPVITGEGRMFPVSVRHIPPLPQYDSSRPDHLAHSTVRAVRQILDRERGDMLVFLPGVGEIKKVADKLTGLQGIVVHVLYGNLSSARQEKAIQPDPRGRQRIILATTIAETSVTIEGITVVVDCGWKRVPRFHSSTGLSGLDTVRISRASARQRSGRAGRLAPGTSYRLWHKGVDSGLQEYDLPEIRQADLAPLVLELANWGVQDASQLSWLDPPPAPAYQSARELLQGLGVLDSQGLLTSLGRSIAGLPLHPRLAAMVSRAGRKNFSVAVDLAALLSERDILHCSESADIERRLECLLRFRQQGRAAVQSMGGRPGACARVDKVSRQLAALVSKKDLPSGQLLSPGGLLALAYPDRVALRQNRSGRYKLVSGTSGVLERHDPLVTSRWLVVASQNMKRRDGRIFLAGAMSGAEVEALFAKQISSAREVRWDTKSRKVTCRTCTRIGPLLLSERQSQNPDPAAVQSALLANIRELGLAVLPWTSAARQLQARVHCLQQNDSSNSWPDMSDQALLENLEEWLGPYLENRKSIRSCGSLPLKNILMAMLDYPRQQVLERDAPTHVTVPSGTRVRLEYQLDNPPVLAVRLQEMFGLAETPTICRGRVQVLLHLLSPARRPVQVTQDLSGFWNSSYFEVRKELKGRYPKHHWPEEPWQAEATARVKRRKKK